jgi:hypothetical protein
VAPLLAIILIPIVLAALELLTLRARSRSAGCWLERLPLDRRQNGADGETVVTAILEGAWRLILVAACWWMFRPHWPVSSAQEVGEGIAFVFFAVLALLGQIGDRD